MKVWMIVLPILGVLVIAGAVTAYFVVAPPTLADDYEKKAEPEQIKAEDALVDAVDSFNEITFGTQKLSSKLQPREFMRRYKRVASRDRRELAKAQRTLRKAKRALAQVDGDAMDPPSWPLLGGDLDEAEGVAEQHDAYMRRARTFLKDYGALIKFEQKLSAVYDRLNLGQARAETRIPKVLTSPGQYTGPMRTILRLEQTAVKQLRKLKPPKGVRREHRETMAEVKGASGETRDMIDAFEANDTKRVDRVYKRMDKRYKNAVKASRKQLQRLLYNSDYRRQIDGLERREDRIAKSFQAL
jgi:hypothetical protein